MIPAAEFLRAAEHLPTGSLDELARGAGLLILAPHPDDESLGCGGLILRAARRGIPVRVVLVSDGSGSHPNSRQYPRDRLVALREAEAREAVRRLGLPDNALSCLRLPDTAVPSDGPTFEAALAEVLRGPARDISVGTVLTTWQGDPHCDHQATHALGRAVARRLGVRLLAYPVWGWSFLYPVPGVESGTPPELPAPPRGWRLDIAGELPAKRHAVAAHLSQTTRLIGDDPAGFVLPPEALAFMLRPYEVYLEEQLADGWPRGMRS